MINKVAKLVNQNGKALKKLWKQTHPEARILFRNDMKTFVETKKAEQAGLDPYQTPPVVILEKPEVVTA